MGDPLTPVEVVGISLLVTNAAQQLDTLARAMVVRELYNDVPRLQQTAICAAKMARKALASFIRRSGEASR